MALYEKYKNDLQELEDCFAAIKQNINVNQNLKLVNRILIRMFGEQFSVDITKNTSNEFFGMCIYPTINTCEKLITCVLEDKSRFQTAMEIWKENKDWKIEIDSILLYDISLNANPKEIVAVLLHEIGHSIYSNSIPQRLFKVMRYQNMDIKLKVRNMLTNPKLRTLLIPTVIEACEFKWFKFLNNIEECEADKFVIKMGYAEPLNDFIAKLIKSKGNALVTRTEKDAEKDIKSVYEWGIVNIDELSSRKQKLRSELNGQIIATPSIYVKKVFGDIKSLFFGKDNAIKFDQIVSEQYLVKMHQNAKRDAELQVMTEAFIGNKAKKIDRSDIDYIRIQTECIESQDDKIYLLDQIYHLNSMIEINEDLIKQGKTNKVRHTANQLQSFKSELVELRSMILKYKIPQKTFSVFIKYPKGYEG